MTTLERQPNGQIKVKDLTEQRFGRWTVIEAAPKQKKGKPCRWVCLCECGDVRLVSGTNLRGRRSTSCGKHNESNLRHGCCDEKIYAVWEAMKGRCYNRNNPRYKRYGGRGIFVCEAWQVFDNFYSDLGSKPENMSLDRIDNNGSYTCGKCPQCVANSWILNCKWSTPAEQSRNTRRNIILEYDGRQQCLKDWATEYGIKPSTLRYRIVKYKWPIERALEVRP